MGAQERKISLGDVMLDLENFWLSLPTIDVVA